MYVCKYDGEAVSSFLLLYLCSLKIFSTESYQEGKVEIPLANLTPPYFCACPKSGPDFQCHMSS